MTRSSPPRLRFWRELGLVGAFYLLYSWVRNQFGSAEVGTGAAGLHASTIHARLDAERLIALERRLHIFHEQAVQSWFLAWPTFLRFWNIFYGSMHFVITIAVLIVCFRWWPDRYRLWRNTLAWTTALALVGFVFFPLMPPRLLCACPYGAGSDLGYRFVDTLERFGGTWSFDSGAVKSLSNQYAAMPSLHIAWSLWCALVVWSAAQRLWVRVLAALYPLATLFAIVVTGNHFLLDAVAGAATLGLGYLLARSGAWLRRRGSGYRQTSDPREHQLAGRPPDPG